jgi:tripartite-type tricarboxylate transporter receptor subunit TctC
MTEVLASPELAEKFSAQGVQVGKLTGESFGKFVESEIARWGAVVRAANVPQQD